MKKLLILLPFIMWVFVSCKPSMEELKEKITAGEKNYTTEIKGEKGIQHAADLLKSYKELIEYYPEADDIADTKFKAANIAMDINESATAVKLFKEYIETVTDKEKIAEVLFYIGFVYENQVMDLESANMYYSEILEKYKETSAYNDAKKALESLGKTPSDLIEEFSDSTDNGSVKTIEDTI